MIFRLLTFIGLMLLGVFITPVLSLPIALWYAARWYAPEMIFFGAVIDAYFGPASQFPYYTIAAFLIVAAAEMSKSYLMLK